MYDVVIADDGKEPINLGRAKALPAGKTMDIDEENITHKLCLTGECEDLCKTVRKLTFFSKDDMLSEFAKYALEHNEKAIFFIHKARKAYDFYKKFPGVATFNCSKSNPLYRYVDESAITRMLAAEKFDTPLLITTSCFDAGVNIADPAVKHIIIDMKDVDTIIQCAGRKRVQSSEDMVE